METINSCPPMQLIYDGKTIRIMPSVDYPSSFSVSANPKRFLNADESVKIIKKIIVPYIKSLRKE